MRAAAKSGAPRPGGLVRGHAKERRWRRLWLKGRWAPRGVRRRLLTARGNPGLATVVAMADALDADVLVVSREGPPAP
jgi:hypothetical protein